MPSLVRELCGVELSYVGWGTTAEELAYCSSAVRSLRDQGCGDGEIVAGLMAIVGVLLGLIPAAHADGAG